MVSPTDFQHDDPNVVGAALEFVRRSVTERGVIPTIRLLGSLRRGRHMTDREVLADLYFAAKTQLETSGYGDITDDMSLLVAARDRLASELGPWVNRLSVRAPEVADEVLRLAAAHIMARAESVRMAVAS